MGDKEFPARVPAGTLSEGASRAFAEALPRLLTLVNDKFSVEARLFSRITREHLSLVADAHEHFGGMLRAVFEFSLYRHMLDEFNWYVSALSSRGLGEEYFRKMVEGWIIAIHATVPPVEAREVSRLLEWLASSVQCGLPQERSRPRRPRIRGAANSWLCDGRKEKGCRLLCARTQTGRRGVEHILKGVILPALIEVGRLWEANEINVSDEHAATEICRYALERLMEGLPREKPMGLRASVGCVPGEQHDIGALLTSVYMEAKGWDVVYLGRSTPESDLLETVERGRPPVCVFSITLIARLPASRDLFVRIREKSPESRVIAGGHAAEIAAETLAPYLDAVVGGIREAHEVALNLVRGNA